MEAEEAKRLRYGFLHNHPTLITRLSTSSILPFLVGEGLISTAEKELIKSEPTEGTKTEKLLDIIHRHGYSNPIVYLTLFNLLSDDSVAGGQHLTKVLDKIKSDSLSDEVMKKFDYGVRFLEEDDRAALIKHKWTIVQSLSVDEILPELISCGAVSMTDKDQIKAESTPNEQALKLLSIVEGRGSRGFGDFVSVLLNSEAHRHLGEMIRGKSAHVGPSPIPATGDDVPVEEILKVGNVPPRQGVYVERKTLIEKIRTALYKLKDQNEGWVIVHGIAGFGKTVLAAEAVRDAKILSEAFSGVHWLTVGKLSDHNGDVDRAKLHSKLQTLILRLDRSNFTCQLPSVEAAKEYLQKVISEQYPKMLLILDDVWSHEVIHAFSLRCRILVTTRVAALISPVLVKNVHSVSVSEGFSDEEGKQLLGMWINKKPEELSSYLDKILEYCRGSPMAIALIGAMLRKNSTERKWKAIADKMENKHLVLSANISNWDYKHPTLNASIDLSVESLPENLREFFEMLTVFDYDTAIPVKVFETIWDVDEFDAEENMNVFMDYSLAQKCVSVEAEAPSYYTIHDIILDYLKATISKEKQRELQKLVVERYEFKCRGAFSDLEDDDYVFRKLIGHIIAAGNFELLGELLSQLNWLISSVVYGDANLLLAHYRDNKTKVPQNFQDDVKKFELFLGGHMFEIATNKKEDDILQLALMQPDDSELYMQANQIVQKNKKKKSWFKWSNKDSDPEKYALKLKVHEDGVSSCKFSEDGEKVLSGAGNEVKLWETTSGMVVGNFKGHTDRVTCCALASNGRLLISSSEDTTVKVWEVKHHRLVCDFKEHQYGVQCCALSPDNKWVISADIDSIVILWDVLLGRVQKRWRLGILSPALTPTAEHLNQPLDFTPNRAVSQESTSSGCNEGVLSCNFSPDGTQFVTSSQNGLIRLWDLNSFSVILTFHGHTTQVKCCVFSKRGSKLASASFDHTARVWDTTTGNSSAVLTHSDDVMVLSCDFSRDASRVITGDTSGSVKVWSLPHGILLQDLPLHWDYVTCVLYSPKTQHILSAADNGIVKILWNDEIEEAESHSESAVQYHRRFSTHFTKEGDGYEPLVLCYVQKENKLQIVKGTRAETVVHSLPSIEEENPRSWIFSNSGDKVLVGYVQGSLQLMKVDKSEWTACEVWRGQSCHNKEVLKCYFSPDDTKVASCCYKQHKLWSVDTGKLISTIPGRGIGVRPLAFLQDSTRIVSIQEKGVVLWDCSTGTIIRNFTYDTKNDNILCIHLSQDNKRLIASASTGLVLVWSITGEPLLSSAVMPLAPCARSCALSPDGSLAVAGFDDGSLKIWDVASKCEIAQQYTGSQYWMVDVAFSPDGSRIVSLCDSIAWWQTDGTHLKIILLKGTFGKYIRFSPDFQTFVTIDNAGLLYILTSLT